jgi:hypothetical protein
MSFIGAAILGSAVLGAGGAMVAGNATRKSQQAANPAANDQATQKNNFDWNSYLLQRGINGGGIAAGQLPTDGAAVNTFLPLWATTNGKPTEQFLLQQILGASGMVPGMGANNDIYASENVAATDDEAYGTLTNAFRQAGSPGAADAPAYTDAWNDAFNNWAGKLGAISGSSGWAGIKSGLLNMSSAEIDQLAELASTGGQDAVKRFLSPPVDVAATPVGVPQAYLDLQNKAVSTVNDLFDGRFLDQETGALAPILAARQKAAQDIFAANETGARSVYDADLLQADTYGQAALQALNRMLAQNTAQRARQGFVGSGSGNALNRARLTADTSQQAAGARAKAGQDLASRLAAAGVGKATTLGAADEQDAIQRLALMTNDTSRRLGAVNLPGSLYNQKLGMERAAADSKFADIDSLLSRLNVFRSGATPAGYTTANVQPVMGSGQIVGGAIQTLAQGVGDYFTTKGLINAVNKSSIPTIDADVTPGWWK